MAILDGAMWKDEELRRLVPERRAPRAPARPVGRGERPAVPLDLSDQAGRRPSSRRRKATRAGRCLRHAVVDLHDMFNVIAYMNRTGISDGGGPVVRHFGLRDPG